jgi:hypothetical protein
MKPKVFFQKSNSLTNPFQKSNPLTNPIPRIIIEFNPADGSSNLRTEGPITIPLVIDTLLAQTNSLWAQFIKSIASPVVGPNGEPTYKKEVPTETPETQDTPQ